MNSTIIRTRQNVSVKKNRLTATFLSLVLSFGCLYFSLMPVAAKALTAPPKCKDIKKLIRDNMMSPGLFKAMAQIDQKSYATTLMPHMVNAQFYIYDESNKHYFKTFSKQISLLSHASKTVPEANSDTFPNIAIFIANKPFNKKTLIEDFRLKALPAFIKNILLNSIDSHKICTNVRIFKPDRWLLSTISLINGESDPQAIHACIRRTIWDAYGISKIKDFKHLQDNDLDYLRTQAVKSMYHDARGRAYVTHEEALQGLQVHKKQQQFNDKPFCQ